MSIEDAIWYRKRLTEERKAEAAELKRVAGKR